MPASGTPWRGPLALALAAFAALLAALGGPGVTIDEPINVGHGATMKAAALGGLPETGARLVERVWRRGHEHPPLTRFLLGLGFAETPFAGPPGLPLKERMVSALFCAAAVGLVARRAGWCAGLALLTMPRWFAHGTLASPEVIAACFLLLAWLAAADALHAGRGWWKAGVGLGLAGLCKLTAVLVPLTLTPVILWTLRNRALRPLLIWWGVAAAVFFAGWPWLWPFELPGYPPGWAGSVARLREFLSTGSDRAAIYTWYFGKQYAGNQAPWHFVWVWHVATLTPAALVMGLAGWRSWWTGQFDVRRTCVLAGWLGSMLFFTMPVHRYDAERIFLFVFPLWAIVAGWGAAALGRTRIGKLVVAALLGWAAWDCFRLAPVGLSYVSPLVGGLRGAERAGLELTYWGDSLTPAFLRAAAGKCDPAEPVELRPALYAGHTHAVAELARPLGMTIVAPEPGVRRRYALVFRRDGYLSAAERAEAAGEVLAELAREGVWLARLVKLPLAERP